jgi:RNA polymerase sigma-70 factor (ECF subfamily)
MDHARITALMDRASSGNDEAFGALALAVQDGLFRLALAQGLGRDDAAEATQEVLLRAYSGRSAWRAGSDAVAWLCGIAMNVARECRRRRRRGTGGLAWVWQDDAGGPDSEQLRLMIEALNDLPLRQREAVACRYLRRMSVQATARAMGCAEGTVKSAVFAALRRLREILEKQP